jgi:hypothetical protein
VRSGKDKKFPQARPLQHRAANGHALAPPVYGIDFVDGKAAPVVQRKTVEVQGGAFKDLQYFPQNSVGATRTRGARMMLEFMPHDFVRAREVSLVQTTNSTVRNHTDPHVPDQPESLLHARRTPGGSAIDQQIYLPQRSLRTNPFAPPVIRPAIVNLDPRYHEERHSATDPFYNPRGVMLGGGQAAIEYTREQREQGGAADRWRPALLKDEPAHTTGPNDVLSGDERFEVAAMADGERYLGSVRWGWRIDERTQQAELEPPEIMPVSTTSASAEFFAAAEAWNRMPVPDPQRGPDFRTMQLPTEASIAALNKQERISMWVRAAMDRYPNADDSHFGNLEDEDLGEFLLTGKIAAWEGAPDPTPATGHREVWNRTFRDLLDVYPQAEQYFGRLSRADFGEFLRSGRISAFERFGQ